MKSLDEMRRVMARLMGEREGHRFFALYFHSQRGDLRDEQVTGFTFVDPKTGDALIAYVYVYDNGY